jgi:hypothetical protein
MTPNSSTAQFIQPPHQISERVSGGGDISEKMLSRADAAVKRLSDQFTDLALDEIGKLGTLLKDAAADLDKRPEIVRSIFMVVHDLRGQGATFDYPLLTRIGSSLCTFTENLDGSGDKELQVIGVHVDALKAVMTHKISGDGGPVGREIAKGLEIAVQKIMA